MEGKSGHFEEPSQAPPPYEPAKPTDSSMQPLMAQQNPHSIFTGVTAMPAIIVSPQVGPNPQSMTCNQCSSQIVTKVNFRPSLRTHLIALLFCVLGLWCCVCVPYCVDSCKNVQHQCPNCNAFLGTYKS